MRSCLMAAGLTIENGFNNCFVEFENDRRITLLVAIAIAIHSHCHSFLEAMNSSSSLLGRSHSCAALKSIATKLLTLLCCCCKSTNKYSTLDALLERKIVELRRQAFAPSSAHQRKQFRSINSVIMKFPLLKDQVQNLLAIFDHYDEDSNGTIDREELKKCFQELQVNLTDLEFDDLFHSCDLDGNGHIQFNEFIVFLCLIYLLTKPSSPTNMVSRIGLAHLEETFDTIIQVFLYMDKNGDGKLNKNDMISALTEAPWERSPSHVTNTRFMEMDRDKDGNVSFREFLFGLTSWLGIDSDEEIPVTDK